MAEVIQNRIWLGRVGFAGLVMTIMVGLLLPLETLPRVWVGPDLMLLVTLVWVLRRPDHAPMPLIAALFFLSDLMFQRPPGLWTALVILLTEALRARAQDMRAQQFLVEWLGMGLGIVALHLAYRFGHAVALVPQAPAGPAVVQALVTIVAYPVMVALAYLLFGINRPAPGQTDALGRPL